PCAAWSRQAGSSAETPRGRGPHAPRGRASRRRRLGEVRGGPYRPEMERTGRWVLRCDGGSRGNPGPGAAAFALFDPEGLEVEARGEPLGPVTNNVAEYRSLLIGLDAAARHGASQLRVCMDSELVIRQMTGEYRVKNAGLKTLHETARRKAARFASIEYRAVPREENARADQLVNETLDGASETESSR